MTYKINSTSLTAQPETGQWIDREELGRDGNGRPIYPAPREFEMRWGFISMSDWSQLRTFFQSVGSTGTVSVDLPQYGSSSWAFRTYSGCILNEPTTGRFFEEYVSDVRLIVTKIQT